MCPRGNRCTYAHSKVELRRPGQRKQQMNNQNNSLLSDFLTNFAFTSDSHLLPRGAPPSQMVQHQTYNAPCDLRPVIPSAAPPNPVNVVSVPPVAQSLGTHTVVIDPRQPIGNLDFLTVLF